MEENRLGVHLILELLGLRLVYVVGGGDFFLPLILSLISLSLGGLFLGFLLVSERLFGVPRRLPLKGLLGFLLRQRKSSFFFRLGNVQFRLFHGHLLFDLSGLGLVRENWLRILVLRCAFPLLSFTDQIGFLFRIFGFWVVLLRDLGVVGVGGHFQVLLGVSQPQKGPPQNPLLLLLLESQEQQHRQQIPLHYLEVLHFLSNEEQPHRQEQIVGLSQDQFLAVFALNDSLRLNNFHPPIVGSNGKRDPGVLGCFLVPLLLFAVVLPRGLGGSGVLSTRTLFRSSFGLFGLYFLPLLFLGFLEHWLVLACFGGRSSSVDHIYI